MDPGTAVGVVSLGMQVCEGILKYYRDWKGYEKDIQEAYTGIDDLAKTFAILYDELQTVPQKAFAIRAQECLATCQDGIQQLEKKLKKVHKEAPAGLRHRAQVGGLRLMYPFRKSTLEKLKEIAQGLMQQLNLALQIIHLSNSHFAQHKADQIQSTLDTTETLVTRIEATALITQAQASATAASVQALLSVEQSREVLEILKWLDAPDPTTNHTQARAKHETGTGEWLLNSQGYQDWISGSSPLLWLHGKAGCCKTILCSTVIEHVFSRVSSQDNVAFAYFYFSFSDAQKQNYTNVLLSMVAQLSRKRSVHPLLSAAHSQAPSQKPSFEVLEHILLALLEESKISYLVVDALDECSEEEREGTLEGFKRVTQSLPEIRLLMTSRKEVDIENFLSSWPVTRLAIDEECVNEDIDLYVKNALGADRKLVKLPSATKKEIEDEFRKKSDGMFRWAALQLDNIRNLKILRPKYISQALYEMPRTLDETYARMLSSIDNLYFVEARAALEWLAFSLRPLSVAELADACSIRVDNTQEPVFEDGGYEALVGLFSVLSSLIIVEDQSDNKTDDYYSDDSIQDPLPNKYNTACYTQKVRLAHFSVKEYLVSNRLHQSHAELSKYALKETEVHRSLSQSCCAYLLHFTEQQNAKIWIDEAKPPRKTVQRHENGESRHYKQDFLKDFAPTYTLLPYFCTHWQRHQALAELVEEQLHVSMSLHLRVLESDRVRTSWRRLCNGSPGATALYWAALFDLRQTVSLLCNSKSSQEINKVGGLHHTALKAAALCGNQKVVETLIASGADVNCTGGLFGTALQAAAFLGHITIVDMLMTNGADVHCEGGLYGTALVAAASNGHEIIVDMLMANGADVGYHGNYSDSTALTGAAMNGHGNMVSKLLKADVDNHTLNFRSGLGTALDQATLRGHEQIVEELLQAGADHGDGMKLATQEGHEGVVRVLVKHGAVYEPADEV
ncbi:hypothetical protein AA0117_g7845 [Alternaria alternata]|uniref:NACHT domain-containing protein n=1 Tax=Alternaria alternata TaxID=5599 RepID=A0A4Q4NCR4_ALTAL|nr:hypothetical protein AA0117_g7845 [Alternaria alternata]